MISILMVYLYLHSTHHSEPILVEGRAQGNPVNIEVIRVGGTDKMGNRLKLEREAGIAFLQMRERMLMDGLEIKLSYAFRTMKQQKALFTQNKRLASRPGLSTHQEGRAIDVSNCSIKKRKGRRDSPICKWLKQHGSEFGFYQTIEAEPWHWEYF